jgi:hypothetical protein
MGTTAARVWEAELEEERVVQHRPLTRAFRIREAEEVRRLRAEQPELGTGQVVEMEVLQVRAHSFKADRGRVLLWLEREDTAVVHPVPMYRVKVAVAVVEAATTEEEEEEVLQRVASVAAAVAVAPAIRAALPLPRRQQVVIQVTSEMPRDEPMVIMFQELV